VVGETVDSILKRRSIPSIVDSELVDSTLAPVESTVASLPGVDSLAAPVSLNKINNGAGSLVASHSSTVVKRSTVTTITSAISSLVSTVTLQLGVVSTVLESLSAVTVPGLTNSPILTDVAAPGVAKALGIIASTLDSTVVDILPVLSEAVEPLADAELLALGGVLEDVNELLASVETVVLSLLESVTAGKSQLLLGYAWYDVLLITTRN